jgi:hypothetical protein
MDTVREQLKRPLVLGIVAFVLGLLLGWFVLGWGLFPVTWTDAAPEHLRADVKVDYLRSAIDSYSLNRDLGLAQQRYAALGEDAEQALEAVRQNPGSQSADAINGFMTAVGVSAPPVVAGTPAAETPAPETAGTPAPGTSIAEAAGEEGTPQPPGSTLVRVVLPVLCVLTLLLVGALLALFFLRSRRGGITPVRPTQPQAATRPSEWTDYSAAGGEAPMVQFMATYKLGDDLFDDSFSVDSPSGEFLGECGVGISETIEGGDPKKVTAFEVWLFDKNDIQTVTKVLMSQFAYMDEAIRQRLIPKGEPVPAEPGIETTLETQSLRMVVRVVDMGYGEAPMAPEASFFDRMILELAIWQK